MTEIKLSTLIIPSVFGILVIGLSMYFHYKMNVLNDKTEEILDILSQQQQVLYNHDKMIRSKPKLQEEEPEIIVSPHEEEPEMIDTPIHSATPSGIQTPEEVPKISVVDFDKELIEELNELKECENKPSIKLETIEEEE